MTGALAAVGVDPVQAALAAALYRMVNTWLPSRRVSSVWPFSTPDADRPRSAPPPVAELSPRSRRPPVASRRARGRRVVQLRRLVAGARRRRDRPAPRRRRSGRRRPGHGPCRRRRHRGRPTLLGRRRCGAPSTSPSSAPARCPVSSPTTPPPSAPSPLVHGARVVRTADVLPARRVADVLAAVADAAGSSQGPGPLAPAARRRRVDPRRRRHRARAPSWSATATGRLMVDEFDGDDVRAGRRRRRRPDAAVPDRAAVVVAPRRRALQRRRRWRRSSPTWPIRCPRPSWCSSAAAGAWPSRSPTPSRRPARRHATPTPPTRARDRQGWIADRGRGARRQAVRRRRPAVAERLGEDVGRLDGAARRRWRRRTAARQLARRRRRAVPRRGRRRAAVGPDRRHRRRRHRQALGRAGRMSGPRRAPPAAADGHAPRPLRPAGPPRRRDAIVRGRGGRVLGIKPGFPAQKALKQYRRLGGGGVHGRSTCWPPPISTCGAQGTSPTTS